MYRRLTAVAVVGALATSSAALFAAPASAARDTGLFGSQSPTYDGVYRQGLSITALDGAGRTIPRSAVSWLLKQQCGNGSFTAYRADTSRRCDKPDPESYTGQDTNATAMATMALLSAGKSKAASRAFDYLLAQQRSDGGLPWFRGGASDSNSTGLFLAAAHGFRLEKAERGQVRAAKRWLASVQLRCTAPVGQRGLLQFQAGTDAPDALGSAQAALGLLTALPVADDPATGSSVRCDGSQEVGSTSLTEGLLHALARDLKAGRGLLPSSFDPEQPDITSSANAAMALAAAQHRKDVLRTAVKALKKAAPDYVLTNGKTAAGSTATLLLAADAAGADPARFGGLDLVQSLLGTLR